VVAASARIDGTHRSGRACGGSTKGSGWSASRSAPRRPTFLATRLQVDARADSGTAGRRVGRYVVEHLALALTSLSAAIVCDPPRIAAARRRRLGRRSSRWRRRPDHPSLALLVFMSPVSSGRHRPAVAASLLYSVLSIVRNTCPFRGIPSSLLRIGGRAGLSPAARLVEVELPLASPYDPRSRGRPRPSSMSARDPRRPHRRGRAGPADPHRHRLDDVSLISRARSRRRSSRSVVQALFGRLEASDSERASTPARRVTRRPPRCILSWKPTE